MYSNITAIILAGGESSRIGTDKALLKINGESVIEKIYKLLTNIFSEIIIISNKPDDFQFLTTKVYKDIYPHFGPLSGIHSGLTNSMSEQNFFITCDMPLITEEVIRFIISNTNNADVTIAKSVSTLHTLLGIYKKSCLPRAEELLRTANSQINNSTGKTKIKLFDLINSVDTDYIDLANENFYNEDIFLNMNTLEDYQKVKDILGSDNKNPSTK